MRKRMWIPVALMLLAVLSGGLWWALHVPADAPHDAPPDGPPWFADITDEVGLHFVHDADAHGKYLMPEVFGSGAALFDCDGDGRLDIYLLTNGGPKSDSINRLFKNMPDRTFKDVTEGSGLGIAGHSMGVAVGDINNDGLPDVLVTQYGGVKLFLNKGGGKFADITEGAGLVNLAWGTSAAFFDYDRDGWLDLVVVNYVDYDPTVVCKDPGGKVDYCKPQSFPMTVSRLFHNRAASAGGVRFDDVSVASGVGRIAGPGLGVLCADFDGDGWPDILVANDGWPNHLWINRHDGTFGEEAASRGIANDVMGKALAGMGVAYGDVDGDGLMDVFVTHLRSETHTLWRQGPRGLFRDRTAAAGLSRPLWQGTGFGTVLGDFDLDGQLDAAVVNGHVVRSRPTPIAELGPHWGWYADRNQLFANDGRGRFTDLSPRNKVFCEHWNVGRGLAAGDIDGDGKLDLLVVAIGAPARLYRNVAPTAGHWLTVRTRLPSPRDPADRSKDRDAIGAEVIIEAGPRRWVRLIHAANSYLSSNDPRAHFGLGDTAQVDRITVLWPDGSREAFAGTRSDRIVEVRQGEGRPVERGGQ